MASRLRKKAQGWGARVRLGEKLARDEWVHLDVPHDQESLAQDRLARLQAMAKRLSELGLHAEARAYLDTAGGARNERGFRAIEQKVEGLAPARPDRAPVTFRRLAERLCDGSLHAEYPGQVKRKGSRSLEQTRHQLAAFFPLLGDKTFDAITREHVREAERWAHRHVEAQGTRSRYLRELRRLLRLAVEPLGLVEHTPSVDVPPEKPERLFQLLYPKEEARLIGCPLVPIERRFAYAFLARNGGRVSEVLQYIWSCIDDDGVLHVQKSWTKTKKARYWPLAPDVLEALKLWRKLQPQGTELIFLPPPGRLKKLTRRHLLRWLHADLVTAGVTRPGLCEALEGERALTIHDLRASCATLARAAGVPDRAIMDRTGHESAAVFEKYDRGVRHARETSLGWFVPMALGLGLEGARVTETWVSALAPGSGQSRAKEAKTSVETLDRAVDGRRPQDPTQAINPAKTGVERAPKAGKGPFGPAGFSLSGQSLKRMLVLAAKDGDLELVAELTEQLRTLPTPSNVIPLKGRT